MTFANLSGRAKNEHIPVNFQTSGWIWFVLSFSFVFFCSLLLFRVRISFLRTTVHKFLPSLIVASISPTFFSNTFSISFALDLCHKHTEFSLAKSASQRACFVEKKGANTKPSKSHLKRCMCVWTFSFLCFDCFFFAFLD